MDDENKVTVDNKTDLIFDELKQIQQKIDSCQGLPDDLKQKANQMLQRVSRMAKLGSYSTEFEILSKYVDYIVQIPWVARSESVVDVEFAKKVLDEHHYGIVDVKERIVEYLSAMKLIQQREPDAESKSPVILFVGLQGIGKTTISISIAEALQRKFVRIAMGGLGSVTEIRGKSRVYPEAEPGQIVKAMIKAGVRNPVILLDEIDKTSGSEGLRFDFMAVLLEILDPAQNIAFRDQYLDYPLDLSEVMFICSANYTNTISAALLDRLEVIKMSAYTDQEKIEIARTYLLPKILKSNGLKPEELTVQEDLWINIARPFGFDAGIRTLQRTLEGIVRKVAREIVEGKSTTVRLTNENIKLYLPKY
ncbi:AAA family ATPase [bacterium]|nr:AAA family ATPase [bacterium]NBO36277.1 AAA family ATPase [bacterium]